MAHCQQVKKVEALDRYVQSDQKHNVLKNVASQFRENYRKQEFSSSGSKSSNSVKRFEESHDKLWRNLSAYEKNFIKNRKISYQGQMRKFKAITGYNSNIYEKLSSTDINTLLFGETLRFFDKETPKTCFIIDRKFIRKCKENFDETNDSDVMNTGTEGNNSDGNEENSNSMNENEQNSSFNDDGDGRRSNDDKKKDDEKENKTGDAIEVVDEIISLENFIQHVLKEEMALIIDDSGVGLSTSLEIINKRFSHKTRDLDKMVFTIDLSKASNIIDIFENSEKWTNNVLIDVTLKFITYTNTLTEMEIHFVKKAFTKKNLVLLWDNIHIVPQTILNIFLNYIIRVRVSKNIQVLTSNMKLLSIMEQNFNLKSFQLVSFTSDERKLFVKNLFNSSQNFEKLYNEIHEAIKKSQMLKDKIFSNISMLKAYCITFSENNDAENTYDVLKRIILNLEETSAINIFDVQNVLMAHESLAIKLIMGSFFVDVEKDKTLEIYDIRVLREHKLTPGLYHKCAVYRLIYSCGNDYYFNDDFIQYFFIAQFLIDHVLFLDPDVSPSDMELRVKVLFFISKQKDSSYFFIRALVNDSIKMRSPELKFKAKLRISNIESVFSTVFDELVLPFSIYFLSRCYEHDQEILHALWCIGKEKNFLERSTHRSEFEKIKAIFVEFFKSDLYKDLNNIGFKIHKKGALLREDIYKKIC